MVSRTSPVSWLTTTNTPPREVYTPKVLPPKTAQKPGQAEDIGVVVLLSYHPFFLCCVGLFGYRGSLWCSV